MSQMTLKMLAPYVGGQLLIYNLEKEYSFCGTISRFIDLNNPANTITVFLSRVKEVNCSSRVQQPANDETDMNIEFVDAKWCRQHPNRLHITWSDTSEVATFFMQEDADWLDPVSWPGFKL